MNAAEKLLAAAEKLEALDKAATPGRWMRGVDGFVLAMEECLPIAEANWYDGVEDADLIATMRGVAAPLAAWLRACSEDLTEHVPEVLQDSAAAFPLAVADAILGGAS